MKPIDLRNETWASLQTRIAGQRLAVLNAWRECGPATTEELAALSDISILTLRPRTTELLALGLIELHGQKTAHGKHHGIYRALSEDEARTQFERHKREALTPQQQFQLQGA